MANRGDVNKLCSNLTQMGVEIRPDELQNLSRVTAFRVMTDFSTAAFLTSLDSLNQPLALMLENCNPSSAAAPPLLNKSILWTEAFVLLSKGGPASFDFCDILRPEPKKFNQLLQQMLKYLFYAAKVYDAVSDECSEIEGAAEEIEKQRDLLDLEKDELRIIEQKIAHINQVEITEEFSRAETQRDEVFQEARRLKSEYADLKSTLEQEQADHFIGEEQLSTTEQQLSELRDLLVSDPESQVSALEQLREFSAAKAALATSKTKQLSEVKSEYETLDHEGRRMGKILDGAKIIDHATEEFRGNTLRLEERIRDTQKCIDDLQSERDRLLTIVETRTQQVNKMNEDERLKSETIEALEREDALKQEHVANAVKLKTPLASELNKKKQEVGESITWTENLVTTTLKNCRELYEKLSAGWKNHVEEVRIFEAECLKTERRLRISSSKLQTLADAVASLD